MRPCPNCGELVAEEANFCHMCGERMVEPPTPPPQPVPVLDEPAQRHVGRWLLLIVGIALLAGLAAVLVLNSPDDQAAPTGPAAVPAPSPEPQDVLAAPGTVQLLIGVANCEQCVITAVPADGSVERSAEVVERRAELTLDRRSTLGLGFTLAHPRGFGEAGGPNVVVLSPQGVFAGSPVGAAQIAGAPSAGICWAGTVEPTATIAIRVEPYGDRTAFGGLRVWADPAQPVLDAVVAPAGDGTVERPALTVCSNEVRLLGG